MSAKRSTSSRHLRKSACADNLVSAGRVAHFKMLPPSSENLMRRFIGSTIVLTLFIGGLCFAFPSGQPADTAKPQQTASAASPDAADPLARLAQLNQRLPASHPSAIASLAAQEGLPGDNLQLVGFGGGQANPNEIVSAFQYGYDGLRHRMNVSQGGVTNTTDYAYDGQNMVQTFKNGGAGETFLTGPRGPEYRRDDVTGQVRWYLYDGTGNVTGEVDPQGNITARRKLDVFGQVRGGNNPGGTSKHKFQGGLGHLSDDETNLTYMRARYFDPVLGRFISEDPAQQGHNWFAYANNNPINLHDFTGKSLGTQEDTEAAGLANAYLDASGGSAAFAVQRLATGIGMMNTQLWDKMSYIMQLLEDGTQSELEAAWAEWQQIAVNVCRYDRAHELLSETLNKQ